MSTFTYVFMYQLQHNYICNDDVHVNIYFRLGETVHTFKTYYAYQQCIMPINNVAIRKKTVIN
jgi:hypothetical protein